MTGMRDVPVDWRIIYQVRVISLDNLVLNFTNSNVKHEVISRGI